MTDQKKIHAPMTCTVVDVPVVAGQAVRAGQTLLVLEAMKMEHEVHAEADAQVLQVSARAGELVAEGELLMQLGAAVEATAAAAVNSAHAAAPGGTTLRADLQEALARHAFTLDANRADAVAKRHALALAAQRSRRSLDDLIANTPADGMVTGIAGINGALFGAERARCVVMAYDATVLAGTQGMRNHQKTDRMLGIALQQKLPVVLFEGGGGRPGDTDMPIVAGLHVTSFASYARLSGQVPVVGIVAGRCFAGNAALLGDRKSTRLNSSHIQKSRMPSSA